MGISGRYIDDAEKLKETAPRVFEQVASGALTLQDAKRQVRAEQKSAERAEKLARADTAPVWLGQFETGCLYQADVTAPDWLRRSEFAAKVWATLHGH